MVYKGVLYIKTVIIFLLFVITMLYIIFNTDLMLINTTELHSMVLFLNDMNSSNNLLEYISLLLIKLFFNVDLHDLVSFFKSVNPYMFGGL